MHLYNTLTRKKETFRPLKKGKVGLYTCGPTVYAYAHIGNLRTYLFEDILVRTLLREGLAVKRVMNITDVGHLTSDADEGRDKLEEGAKREKKSPWDLAQFYTKAFLKDLKALNMKKPSELAPATKFIPEQIELIKRLFERGYAYETSRAVYFDISRLRDYGKLVKSNKTDKPTASDGTKRPGGRRGRAEVVEDPEKRNPQDFALWFKRVGRFKNHIMHWSSPWGLGFPGWHLECSAISTALLGQPFDIHAGGVDHIAVHHTNEIAQSEAAYGKPLARYWVHGAFLLMKNAKMAKSAGTFLTLGDLIARGFDPLAYRLFVLGAHYRAELTFSWEALRAAAQALERLRRTVATLKAAGGARKPARPSAAFRSYEKTFNEALADDLNTPRALATLWAAADDQKLAAGERLALLLSFDEVLGLGLADIRKPAPLPAEVQRLAAERELYRRRKQFAQADALREKIAALGYTVDDTPSGPLVQPTNSKPQIPNHK